MQVVDSVKEFFIKKILLPQVFRIDVPGYVVGKFYTLEGQHAFVRNIFLSEPFFVVLEDKVNKKFGKEGLKKLYGAGKSFGYRFSTLNKLPRSNIMDSVKLTFKFFESLYAEKLDVNINLENKLLILDTFDLVVTRINGGGFSLTVGGCAGIWSYLMGDYNMECGIVKNGDRRYTLICGPREELRTKGVEFFESEQTPQIGVDKTYEKLNKPQRNIPADSFDINKLMQTGLFTYSEGDLKFSSNNVRFVPIEVSLPYELEKLVGEDIVFEAATEAFLELGKDLKKQKDSYRFLANMLTALGYGIVTIEELESGKRINFLGFPWYNGCKNSSLPFIRGAIVGFLKGQLDKDIKIGKLETRELDEMFLVSIGVGS